MDSPQEHCTFIGSRITSNSHATVPLDSVENLKYASVSCSTPVQQLENSHDTVSLDPVENSKHASVLASTPEPTAKNSAELLSGSAPAPTDENSADVLFSNTPVNTAEILLTESLECNNVAFECNVLDDTELNSYKFPKPRVYNPNLFESNNMDVTDLLSNISTIIGCKERPPHYIRMLEQMLQRSVKPKKQKAVSLNSLNNADNEQAFLKSVDCKIDASSFTALMDTGSTHNLLSHDVFQTLKNRQFKSVNMDMKVAGATLTNNIVGQIQLNTIFKTTTGNITIPVSYLIAHQLNGYQSILGAELLTNPRVIKATTPYHIHLNDTYNNAVLPLSSIIKPPNFNSSRVEKKEEVDDFDNIDEEIIQEHILIDPTKLDEKLSHLDCEISPTLSESARKKLCKIIEDNKDAFATSKLDVGQYKKFLVKLEIDDHIPSEKKRFMSEEKADFCDKTFEKFENLGIIEECHTPKTVSNLLLVPKFEGIKDSTKASTFLAEMKGSKNKQFRIVQDLRRINKVTKNVKRSLPKIPEHIFQKLKNKIVSSVDTLQAYWHLTLHPDSRPYTCFYLKNRIMQFNRMPQGFISASACWDQAMLNMFSPETLAEIKLLLSPEEAAMLGLTFEEFFTFYQDDSWIFSDTEELHLLHIKVVLMAYRMNSIKLSPKKCTFFPEELTILGVSFSPVKAELALDKLKAQSILEWEKPDSLYTLQSRLYSLNYWSKFIPSLSELKFPLNQILRSQIFSWDEQADMAWNRIKALIALDIRLTVPLSNEKLLVTTDASKIACSAILWVHRNENLRVVACHSKLFSHTDSLKSIHFKETYALISAFAHFRPYLLNTSHPVTVFTDARALIWVGRNREYSIACNSLSNKLGQLQMEIPHIIYSVPSETNYLADVFSRSFNTSRFLDKQKFALSKFQASKIPPLTEPFIVDEATLYAYFTNSLNSEDADEHPRNKPKISTPKPIKNLYKLFENCTPEEKYYSAIRLLQGWNDPTIKPAVKLNSSILTEPDMEENALDLLERNSATLFSQHCEQIIRETMEQDYKNLDSSQQRRLKNTLRENYKKLLRQNMKGGLKSKFISHEVMLNSLTVNKNTSSFINGSQSERSDRAESFVFPVYYTMLPQVTLGPEMATCREEILIPLQTDLNLDAGENRVIDSGIQFFIPEDYYMQLAPMPATLKYNVYVHHGIIDSDFNGTIKLLIRNFEPVDITIPKGTFLSKGIVIPVLHPNVKDVGLDYVTAKDLNYGHWARMIGSSDTRPPPQGLTLIPVPLSPLHALLAQKTPISYHVPELNITIRMPMENGANTDVSYRISKLNQKHNAENLRGSFPPIISSLNTKTEIMQLTRKLVDRTAYLHAVQADDVPTEHKNIRSIKQELYEDMCKKLAIISVDLIKNQFITSATLAKAQQADDLLSPIRENIHTDAIRNKGYELKNQVLYRTFRLPNSNVLKYALCIPDILLPAVIHHLHVILGHPTYSTLLKNFRIYYHAPAAQILIKKYSEACTTCALANKFDVQKIMPSVERTMKPTRPRQHLYADLIPMFKGTFSYILFALDAYSQYVYAIPLKDKTAASVLQGFLSIFGTTGWYENIYLDNETSFVKTAKLLIKIAPIQVHYSTPYCHFQNSSENYIKNFKKTFLKILNDQENPRENSDWPLLLPTVVQALNRQVISCLGVSRETIHHNSTVNFYPLAELTFTDSAELSSEIDHGTVDHFKQIVLQRKKRQKYAKNTKVPQYTEKAIVFMRDMIPSVSNILKIPQRGPFQIVKIHDRNVTLTDLDTGQTVHTHLELIRPLDLKEFKFFLNKKWDLNVHHQKAIDRRLQPGIFDEPSHPVPLTEITEPEPPPELQDEIDLEYLFYPPPKEVQALAVPASISDPVSLANQNPDRPSSPMEQMDKIDPLQELILTDNQSTLNPDVQDEFDLTETNAISSAKTNQNATPLGDPLTDHENSVGLHDSVTNHGNSVTVFGGFLANHGHSLNVRVRPVNQMSTAQLPDMLEVHEGLGCNPDPSVHHDNDVDISQNIETTTDKLAKTDFSQINSLHAYMDVSKEFRNSLKTKKERLVSFFLTKQDQYIKLPAGDNEID